ncbi:MAG: hypothetical protein P8166_17940 [Candidatus Thiodiazotropha sp.]|jgi:hypothetical protein
MSYDTAAAKLVKEKGVEYSTLMNSPCLRYNGAFLAMMFSKQDALIIKVSPERVDELIASGKGLEFNFTKKKFKEWVLIPSKFENHYEIYMREALAYVKRSTG